MGLCANCLLPTPRVHGFSGLPGARKAGEGKWGCTEGGGSRRGKKGAASRAKFAAEYWGRSPHFPGPIWYCVYTLELARIELHGI